MEMSTLAGVFGRLLTGQNFGVLPKLDCVVQYAWNTFAHNEGRVELDSKTIETAVRKCLDEKEEPIPAMALKLQFLLLLTRLVDGERHYLFQYNPNTDEARCSTVLESALLIYDSLLRNFPEIKKKAARLRLKILQQAVFVCCRRGNFAMATNVYEFAELEVNVNEVLWEEMKSVVKTEDSSHPALTENSYQQFCKLMSEKLKFLLEHLALQECSQGCPAHVRSVCLKDEEERAQKFDEDMLKKLMQINIKRWLPREHKAVLENECFTSEQLNDSDIRQAACNINIALCQMDLIKELPLHLA